MEELDWILDSSSSLQICAVKNYFFTYKAVDENTVNMVNNTANKVVGVGIVLFHMHDERILKLTKVGHVPGLRKNLIYLGMLDSQGCRFLSSGGVLEVFKGDRMMMRGTKVGNLCVDEES